MEKLQCFLKWISLAIIILVPILAVVCLSARWWNFLQDVIPFPAYVQFKTNLTLLLVCGSFLFFFALIGLGLSVPNKPNWYSLTLVLVLGGLISIPMFCIFGFLAVSPDLLIGSATLGSSHYFVTAPTEFGDMWVDHQLHKCNEKDLECDIVYEEAFGGSQIYPASFFIDKRSHEIHFFLGRWLKYTDGPYPHQYKLVVEEGVLETSKFGVYRYEKNAFQEFVITKCDGNDVDDRLSCEVLPMRYSTKTFGRAALITDEQSKQIKLLIDDHLIFSYDTTSHCYSEGCIITEQ